MGTVFSERRKLKRRMTEQFHPKKRLLRLSKRLVVNHRRWLPKKSSRLRNRSKPQRHLNRKKERKTSKRQLLKKKKRLLLTSANSISVWAKSSTLKCIPTVTNSTLNRLISVVKFAKSCLDCRKQCQSKS